MVLASLFRLMARLIKRCCGDAICTTKLVGCYEREGRLWYLRVKPSPMECRVRLRGVAREGDGNIKLEDENLREDEKGTRGQSYPVLDESNFLRRINIILLSLLLYLIFTTWWILLSQSRSRKIYNTIHLRIKIYQSGEPTMNCYQYSIKRRAYPPLILYQAFSFQRGVENPI